MMSWGHVHQSPLFAPNSCRKSALGSNVHWITVHSSTSFAIPAIPSGIVELRPRSAILST